MCITPFNSIDSLIVVIESMDFLKYYLFQKNSQEKYISEISYP